MDAMWLVPTDTYYHNYVKKIFTSVINSLELDSSRTFTQAEIYFFQRWYYEQDEQTQQKVKNLVADGQLLFANGGWVAHDEACPSFNAIISSIYEGHRFLNDEFGVIPKVGWQIDSYGNSAANALLYAQMGYEGMIMGRLNEDMLETHIDKQQLEFYWRPYFSDRSPLGKNEIFVSVLPHGYTAPVIRLDNNWQEAEGMKDTNELVRDLSSYFYFLGEIFRTSHILIPMGDDFSFIDAKKNYDLIDEVIELTRQYDSSINIFYSSPKQYIDAVLGEGRINKITWDTYDGDFFPYMTDDEERYWVGYFSTRPDLKEYISQYESLAYSSQFLYSKEFMKDPTKKEFFDEARYLMQNLSIAMHHDTITGTSAQQAVNQLYKDLKDSLNRNEVEMTKILNDFAEIKGYRLHEIKMCKFEPYDHTYCPQGKVRRIDSEDEKLLLILYNPSLEVQRVPVLSFLSPYIEFNRWEEDLTDFDEIYSEAMCYTNSDGIQECDLFLNATIEPLDIELIEVKIQQDDYDNQTFHVQPDKTKYQDVIYNGLVSLEYEEYDFLTGKVYFWMQDLNSKAKQEIGFDFRQYLEPYEEHSGGHYVFHTDYHDSEPYYHKLSYSYTYRGELVEEYFLSFRNMREMVFRNVPDSQMDYWVKVRVYKDHLKDNTIEWDVFFGRIPNLDKSIELTINWQAYSLENLGLFYTDANAYKMIRRRARDVHHEDEFHSREQETLPANFYPVTSGIVLEDTNHHMTLAVINDKPMAGSSYIDGRIELLINRRLYTTDDLGIPEVLDEHDENGNGLNVSAIFRTVLTTSKENAFQQVWNYYNRRLWKVQTFFTQKYEMRSPSSDAIFLNSHRALTVRAMHIQQIKNFIMLPDDREGKTFQLRLTMEDEGLEPDLSDVAKQLCKLIFYQDDSWCEIQSISVKQRRLDGVKQAYTEDNRFTLVQIYEVNYNQLMSQEKSFLQ